MATPHRGAPAYRPDDGASLYNAAQWGTFLPNIGWWAQQPGVLGVVSTASPRQQCYASPFPIGPVGFEVDAFRYRIGTAAAGGANLRAEVGLYRDDGTGFPDADTRLAFAESTDFSAGDRDLTFTPVFLKPGLYWMMWVYSATQSPSTNPAFSCISNASYALPVLNSQPPGSLNRALLVARTTLPTERSQFTRSGVGVTGNNNAPMVMLRRSA